jgi:arylsulfatase A-like enzyme
LVLVAARSGALPALRSLRAPRYVSGSLKDYNVLLITMDTTRADHLPMYGYKNVKTPGLDRLAETSFIFEDAIAHVPLTLPSHTSILTGQLPIGHGVRDNEGFVVDPKVETLASILKTNGYATAAFVSAFVLDARWGLNRGFDSYFDNFNQYQEVNRDDIQRRAEQTAAEVEKWLPANKDKRFFCWVHFYDPPRPVRSARALRLPVSAEPLRRRDRVHGSIPWTTAREAR